MIVGEIAEMAARTEDDEVREVAASTGKARWLRPRQASIRRRGCGYQPLKVQPTASGRSNNLRTE